MNHNTNKKNFNPFGFCNSCNSIVEISEVNFFEYFNSSGKFCSACDNFDLYQFLKKTIDENFMNNFIYSLLGAKNTIFQITLEPDKKFELNFTDFQIPKAAKILNLNFTPNSDGGLFPIEMHNNHLYRGEILDKIILYPAKLEKKVHKTVVAVSINWIDITIIDDGYLYKSFLESFFCYVDKKYDSCILPLNIAIESKFSQAIDFYNDKFLKIKKTSNITYNIYLNNIFPLIISNHNLIFPKEILNNLNKLRKARNNLAHTGKMVSVSKSIAVDYLSSAIFSFVYLKYFEMKLDLLK